MNKLVEVNKEQCHLLGDFLKTANLPSAKEEVMQYNISKLTMSNLYFAMVAICHQTTPHHGPALQGYVDGKLRKGWDYLREKMILATQKNPDLVSLDSLTNFSAKDIEKLFFDEKLGSTISDPEGRAMILRSIGLRMGELRIKSIWSLYKASSKFLISEKRYGLIELLSQFGAYSADPVKKKLFFFLALMFNQNLWRYYDPENLGTPVDYHEVRGHLRYGTVKIVDEHLYQQILTGKEVTSDEDVQIRKAVFEAIMLVSKVSERTPNDLHYFFWNIFRNCCRRDETHCVSHESHSSFPERYQSLSPDKCIFANSCKSIGLDVKLSDHLVNTSLY